jgi:FliG C-terminal domain
MDNLSFDDVFNLSSDELKLLLKSTQEIDWINISALLPDDLRNKILPFFSPKSQSSMKNYLQNLDAGSKDKISMAKKNIARKMNSLFASTIYVNLIEEGTHVMRPVFASKTNEPDVFVIREGQTVPETEKWEFTPGTTVRVKDQLSEGIVILVASEQVALP